MYIYSLVLLDRCRQWKQRLIFSNLNGRETNDSTSFLFNNQFSFGEYLKNVLFVIDQEIWK